MLKGKKIEVKPTVSKSLNKKLTLVPNGVTFLGGLHLFWLTFQSDWDVANPEPFMDQENISVFAPYISDVP